jgi:hypothetical protein
MAKNRTILLTDPFGWLVIAAQLAIMASACGGSAPDFREVCDLIRSNLTGVAEADLNQAALDGVLQRFRGQVMLLTNAPGTAAAPSTDQPSVSRTNVFDGRFGYLRIGSLVPGTADAFAAALGQLNTSNRLQGLILDLRFATGSDYAEAGRVADRLVADERPLLRWGTETVRSTAKTNAFGEPVAVLVNAQTSGAPEALAGSLRQANVGLLIGTPTAGQASVFQEHPLSNGQRLLLASARVQLGSDREIPTTGLTPDIVVAVALDEERLDFSDPYRTSSVSGTALPRGTNLAALGTNRPIRITEADLVRMRREGVNLDDEEVLPPTRRPGRTAPVVTDPALARALDLLKGLAVVRSDRSAPPRRPK